jgi:hypothetical protein
MAEVRTEVSKSNPAIKKIIAATIGDAWKGKRVVVIEAGRGWEHMDYIDDYASIFMADLAESGSGSIYAQQTPRPAYGGRAVVHTIPDPGHALVIKDRFGLEIIIPGDGARGSIDSVALSVVEDALLAGNKKAAQATLAQFGAYAGLAGAIAEAHARTLQKAERGSGDTAGLTKGAQTKAKRSAARLDAEIKAILGRR